MATDIGKIVENLVSFYDFKGKDVVHVGAGGGQLVGYAHSPRKITAIDNDRSAVERLPVLKKMTFEATRRFDGYEGL
ncbi:MAG: hypothetical protein PHD74_03785 [Candidatus Krumholzibacteria bacterium]|nr:hypothetical protein [Candidatus Krumholzibacteria bacterium]